MLQPSAESSLFYANENIRIAMDTTQHNTRENLFWLKLDWPSYERCDAKIVFLSEELEMRIWPGDVVPWTEFVWIADDNGTFLSDIACKAFKGNKQRYL